MAITIEGHVVVAGTVLMVRAFLVMVAQIAVVLQHMKYHLRHSHPLAHIHGAIAIKGKG